MTHLRSAGLSSSFSFSFCKPAATNPIATAAGCCWLLLVAAAAAAAAAPDRFQPLLSLAHRLLPQLCYWAAAATQHGLSFNTMALITSFCGRNQTLAVMASQGVHGAFKERLLRCAKTHRLDRVE